MKVPGFMAAGIYSGVKRSGKKDLALIYSDKPCCASAVFTKNLVKAAPVLIGKKKIRRGLCQAVIINSGIANVCTGKQGLNDANEITRFLAKNLNIDDSLIIPSSTGLIGAFLSTHLDNIKSSIPYLISNLSVNGFETAAESIMTTDAFPKFSCKQSNFGSKSGTVAAIGKGAGMIAPNMATMLCFAVTDIALDRKSQDIALKNAVNSSFNKIIVDGDMSTNDTVLLMSSAALGHKTISTSSYYYKKFEKLLTEVLSEIAYKIVEDGEGATKVAKIIVKGAKSVKDAEAVTHTIGTSTLVKTALYGQDPNWGRIVAAAGRAGVKFNPDKIDLHYGDYLVFRNGKQVMDEKIAAEKLKPKYLEITLNLKSGKATSYVLTSDLTIDYVKFNSDYHT